MADPLRPSGPQIPGSLMGEIQSEVAVEATPLLSFVLRNSRIIVTCIVLLVLVIAGVGGRARGGFEGRLPSRVMCYGR